MRLAPRTTVVDAIQPTDDPCRGRSAVFSEHLTDRAPVWLRDLVRILLNAPGIFSMLQKATYDFLCGGSTI